MATPDDGLAAVVYGPSEVTTTVRGGATVTHRGTDRLSVPRERLAGRCSCKRAARFPLVLRIPGVGRRRQRHGERASPSRA